MLFIGAFGVGAILWCVWMVPIVLKTRQTQPDNLYPTFPKSPTAVSGNRPPVATNGSVTSSNGAAGGAK